VVDKLSYRWDDSTRGPREAAPVARSF
jgi:hypothetical protein